MIRRGAGTGFSLVELLLVVSLLGIVLALAVPAYRQYAARAWRTEAIQLLLGAAACQERVFARSGVYDTRRCTRGFDSLHYRLRYEPESKAAAATFTILAEPLDDHSPDPCGSLGLNQSGTRSITGAVDLLRKCWEGR